MNLTNLT